jgi:hypothetical protein
VVWLFAVCWLARLCGWYGSPFFTLEPIFKGLEYATGSSREGQHTLVVLAIKSEARHSEVARATLWCAVLFCVCLCWGSRLVGGLVVVSFGRWLVGWSVAWLLVCAFGCLFVWLVGCFGAWLVVRVSSCVGFGGCLLLVGRLVGSTFGGRHFAGSSFDCQNILVSLGYRPEWNVFFSHLVVGILP